MAAPVSGQALLKALILLGAAVNAPPSPSDGPGGVYNYTSDTSGRTTMKIGCSIDPPARQRQWERQCCPEPQEWPGFYYEVPFAAKFEKILHRYFKLMGAWLGPVRCNYCGRYHIEKFDLQLLGGRAEFDEWPQRSNAVSLHCNRQPGILLAHAVAQKGPTGEQKVLRGECDLRFPPAVRTLAGLLLNNVQDAEEKAALRREPVVLVITASPRPGTSARRASIAVSHAKDETKGGSPGSNTPFPFAPVLPLSPHSTPGKRAERRRGGTLISIPIYRAPQLALIARASPVTALPPSLPLPLLTRVRMTTVSTDPSPAARPTPAARSSATTASRTARSRTLAHSDRAAASPTRSASGVRVRARRGAATAWRPRTRARHHSPPQYTRASGQTWAWRSAGAYACRTRRSEKTPPTGQGARTRILVYAPRACKHGDSAGLPLVTSLVPDNALPRRSLASLTFPGSETKKRNPPSRLKARPARARTAPTRVIAETPSEDVGALEVRVEGIRRVYLQMRAESGVDQRKPVVFERFVGRDARERVVPQRASVMVRRARVRANVPPAAVAGHGRTHGRRATRGRRGACSSTRARVADGVWGRGRGARACIGSGAPGELAGGPERKKEKESLVSPPFKKKEKKKQQLKIAQERGCEISQCCIKGVRVGRNLLDPARGSFLGWKWNGGDEARGRRWGMFSSRDLRVNAIDLLKVGHPWLMIPMPLLFKFSKDLLPKSSHPSPTTDGLGASPDAVYYMVGVVRGAHESS
ncbi:hypothetical protein DFH07DRAFT_995158 [Mycena maculata]|uniref:Bacteriophage T5 Orf172 DNA-binding domain-containing protein n=1 Tax=Mycena maculata TaxID=230809 RepID=A0AAD7HWH9_9AGAR|nr:hypothetical protein DFH07DRAFT_995158 [Mycena maculata]